MHQVIVITGGSAGIGAELARQAAKKGHEVVVTGRRQAELEAVAKSCGDALAVVADATVRADHQRVLDAAIARFGRVDVWVNNAGRGITKPASELTDDDLDAMIRDNVKSALYGMQTALAHFKPRGTGQIVNVSSGLGRVPSAPFRSAYVAAKHALNGLTATLRLELMNAHPGIHVSLALPGVVATDFGKNAMHGGPDSRALPGAQAVEGAATVILDLIEKPRAEAYTQPAMQAYTEAYYRDVEGVEREIAARFKQR